jgi:hypothetical protein
MANARWLVLGGLSLLVGSLCAFQRQFREYPGIEYEDFAVPPDAHEKTEFAFARLMYPPAPTAMFDRAGPKACPAGRRIIRAPIAIFCWPSAASLAFTRVAWSNL